MDKLKETMDDMLQKNVICNYVFFLDGEKIAERKMYALSAYMTTYHMSNRGDAECYMAPDGVRAAKPVFSVINGIVKLSGITIE